MFPKHILSLKDCQLSSTAFCKTGFQPDQSLPGPTSLYNELSTFSNTLVGVFFPLIPTANTVLIKGRVHRINFSALIIEEYNPNLFNELIISHRGILIMKYF